MFTQDTLDSLMKNLGEKGCFFYSEKNFQSQLAMCMRELYSGSITVTREYSTEIHNECVYVDITLQTQSGLLPIELKYKLQQKHTNTDNARYDFFKDVWRIEQFLSQKEKFGPIGYAIFLTNDSSFWDPPRKESKSNAREFRMHQGCEISGERTWWESNKTEPHHNRYYQDVFKFRGTYPIVWKDYSNNIVIPEDAPLPSHQSGVFKYAVVEVTR